MDAPSHPFIYSAVGPTLPAAAAPVHSHTWSYRDEQNSHLWVRAGDSTENLIASARAADDGRGRMQQARAHVGQTASGEDSRAQDLARAGVAVTEVPDCDAQAWLVAQGFDLAALAGASPDTQQGSEFIPDLASYDRAIVALSGGKDSVALLLHLIDCGFPREKIECHHHLVDGDEGSDLMDWPVTRAYCQALCAALGVSLTFSWRVGGLLGEMLPRGSPTAPMKFPLGDGYGTTGGSGPLGTRRKFPQVTASLAQRWCSSSLKIGPFCAYLANNPKFLETRTLVLTGERAEESRARENYLAFEPHRADTRHSRRVPRHIDVWRAVHLWPEARVWETMRRWRIVSHPAYWNGYGRTSCRLCIFSSKNQWATSRLIAPRQFEEVANYEREFKITIHRKQSVTQRADAGTPYTLDPKWVAIANGREFNEPIFMDPWVLPPGAFGESCGPT